MDQVLGATVFARQRATRNLDSVLMKAHRALVALSAQNIGEQVFAVLIRSGQPLRPFRQFEGR